MYCDAVRNDFETSWVHSWKIQLRRHSNLSLKLGKDWGSHMRGKELGSFAGPVIQKMGGWHLRMTWGQEVCYASLHSEPVSALGLPTVWSLWGNPGMARCREMSTLPAGYIPQRKVTSASSSGSLGFIVCVWSVVGWLIVYQDGDYLYPGQYSQTICW